MSETRNAVIRDAVIEIEDHGMLTAWLYLDYGGSSQGFGGYGFYGDDPGWWKKDMPYCARFIWRCLAIAGVDRWHALKGKSIRVRMDGHKIHAIGHIIKNDWFDPSEEKP